MLTPRKIFLGGSVIAGAAVYGLSRLSPGLAAWAALPVLVVVGMGIWDLFQEKHAIRRNFPFVGRFRYWLEIIRPELHQFFVESNASGQIGRAHV